MIANAYSTGTRPCWELDTFQKLVLGNSLLTTAAEQPAEVHERTITGALDAIGVLTAQLAALSVGGQGATVKPTLARTHASFARMTELGGAMKAVVDNQTFLEFLTSFVTVIKALTPGSSMVVPGGWNGAVVIYVLHCDSFESYTLAICSTAEGLQYHPTRIDEATGALQHNTPLLIRDIPAHRVRDSAVWCLLLRAALFPDKQVGRHSLPNAPRERAPSRAHSVHAAHNALCRGLHSSPYARADDDRSLPKHRQPSLRVCALAICAHR